LKLREVYLQFSTPPESRKGPAIEDLGKPRHRHPRISLFQRLPIGDTRLHSPNGIFPVVLLHEILPDEVGVATLLEAAPIAAIHQLVSRLSVGLPNGLQQTIQDRFRPAKPAFNDLSC